VLDEVYRVKAVPPVDSKGDATEFMAVGGGCAANAAVAIARLGGRVRFAGPLGDDDIGARTLANLAREHVDTTGCVSVKGGRSSVSAILVDESGARTIVTYADPKLLEIGPENAAALVKDVDGVLLDNRRPKFVVPICREAARRRLPIVLDVDKPATPDDPLLAMATHAIFSGESLRDTFKGQTTANALMDVHKASGGFAAVTDGPNDVLWTDGGEVHALPAFKVTAVDTLGAGDVFHGAFAFALLEGKSMPDALRFAAAASAVKVQRFGGSATAPTRAEVEAMLRR
jgi:sugar/nucleoside kinase (ribokinase family)